MLQLTANRLEFLDTIVRDPGFFLCESTDYHLRKNDLLAVANDLAMTIQLTLRYHTDITTACNVLHRLKYMA